MTINNVGIASDHAGFNLKEYLKLNFQLVDYGTDTIDSVDYPDFCKKIIQSINDNIISKAILICGSGIGMSIAANRYKNIRAALCYNKEAASLSRKHNDANIIVFGAKMMSQEEALQCTKIFFETEFESGRHLNRIKKIDEE